MGRRFIILCACLFAFSGMLKENAHAQYEEEFLEFAFGEVARISKDYIAVLEYDFDTEENVEIVYDVNESTKFVNIEALSALRIGDAVEIEFKEENNKRLAVEIVKEEDTLLDEDFEEEMMNGLDGEEADNI